MTTPRDALIQVARDLKSESGENPEYDRALVELVGQASGLGSDDYPALAREIGIVRAERTSWGFHAAASVWFNVNALGEVISVDVNVLDGVDHPDEMWEMENDGTPEQKEEAREVWERANTFGWKVPTNWILPTGFYFGGAF